MLFFLSTTARCESRKEKKKKVQEKEFLSWALNGLKWKEWKIISYLNQWNSEVCWVIPLNLIFFLYHYFIRKRRKNGKMAMGKLLLLPCILWLKKASECVSWDRKYKYTKELTEDALTEDVRSHNKYENFCKKKI